MTESLETESLIDNLKDSLKDHEAIGIRLDKKVNIFEALDSNIEKENDKIESINHKNKLIGLEEESVNEEKSRKIEKIRLQINNYENEIISNKTWISSSRFEEKQVLGEIRLWKKELNSLNAEKKLINIEIEKSQLIASQKEAEADIQRDLNIEKIQNEQNVEIDKEKAGAAGGLQSVQRRSLLLQIANCSLPAKTRRNHSYLITYCSALGNAAKTQWSKATGSAASNAPPSKKRPSATPPPQRPRASSSTRWTS